MTAHKSNNIIFLDLDRARFPLGRLVFTPGVEGDIPPDEVSAALERHLSGDWGDLDDDDRAENDLSLREGFRLLSVYRTEAGVKFWVITEGDRSATTVLLPSEY